MPSGLAAVGMARTGLVLHEVLDRGHRLMRDVTSGLCLGLFSQNVLSACCALTYDDRDMYRTPEYNLSGLREWERRFVERYPSPGTRLLVPCAGAGREVLALHRRGFDVVAFECQPRLAEWGSAFLRSRGVPVQIRAAPPNRFPSGLPSCGGVIVGWGGYSHICPGSARIEFLRGARALLSPGDALLVSFLERSTGNGDRATRLACRLRRVLGRDALEPGDIFGPPPMHLFTGPEIEREITSAGFRLDRYESEGSYPHAVAIAVD